MSNISIPFSVASCAAVISWIFPTFVSYRFARNQRELGQITPTEKIIQFVTIAGLFLLHAAEGLKATRFGLELRNNTNSFIPISAIIFLIHFVTEVAHILLVAIVLLRLISLLDAPRSNTSDQIPITDQYTVASIGIMTVRILMPVLVLLFRFPVNALGKYSLFVFALEAQIFLFATILSSEHLKMIHLENQFEISTWRFYSNPIITLLMTVFSTLVAIIMGANYRPSEEESVFTMSSDSNITLLIMPSIYAIVMGTLVIFFQDSKAMIQQIRAENGIASKRTKFESLEQL